MSERDFWIMLASWLAWGVFGYTRGYFAGKRNGIWEGEYRAAKRQRKAYEACEATCVCGHDYASHGVWAIDSDFYFCNGDNACGCIEYRDKRLAPSTGVRTEP